MATLSEFPGLSVTVCINGNDVQEPESADTPQQNGRDVDRFVEYKTGSHCSIVIKLDSTLPFRDSEDIVNIEVFIEDHVVGRCAYRKVDVQSCNIYEEIDLQSSDTKHLASFDTSEITVKVSLGMVMDNNRRDHDGIGSEFIAQRALAQEEQKAYYDNCCHTKTGTGDFDIEFLVYEVTRQIGAFHFKNNSRLHFDH